MDSAENMLKVDDIHTYIGESYILQGVSMTVPKGKVVAVLGRNGVGKTTLIHSIIGFHTVRKGTILLEGEKINDLPAYKVARKGIGLVPQGRRLFPSLTVRENLEVPRKCSSEVCGEWDVNHVFTEFPALEKRKDYGAGRLSGGEQQMLSMGRGLVSRPKLLLMDEPSEGLSPLMVSSIGKMIKSLSERGLSVLLVEQKLGFALTVADHVYVMSKGRIVYHSSPSELSSNEEVKGRYLGV